MKQIADQSLANRTLYFPSPETENSACIFVRPGWKITGNNNIGHKPYRPQTISATTCTISATHNVDIGHKLTNISRKEWKWNAGM